MRTAEEVFNEVYQRLEEREAISIELSSELNQHGVQVSTVMFLVDEMREVDDESE